VVLFPSIYVNKFSHAGDFLPFGLQNRDNQLPKTDDGASSSQTDATYTFFGSDEDMLYVSYFRYSHANSSPCNEGGKSGQQACFLLACVYGEASYPVPS
jgi:hypothetical protein